MKVFLFIILTALGTSSFAKTQYTTLERLALLLPGNEQELKDYKTELYNSKYKEAHRLMTSAYIAFLDFDNTGNTLYLNRAIILADQFNSNLRFLAHNQQYGDKEKLITLAVTARYEFYYEFEKFLNRSWVQEYFSLFEVANFKTIAFDFKQVYVYDLGQPRGFN
ncbi:MAG: hypothetical protein MK008_01825 [Bdellovibrionales bacterium]|nr:hypothetical protein [Bdellovibrionales bacterium]